MAFKDAFKDVVGMFDSPKVQNVIGALAQAQRPAQASVAENLTVPFGATFEQGMAMRGMAQEADQNAALRRAAEQNAQAEAQRIALEGRRVSEGERQGEHDRSMNTLSDADELQRAADNRMNEITAEGTFRAEEGRLNREHELEAIAAESGSALSNAQELYTMQTESPMGRAELAETESRTEYNLAQAVNLRINRELDATSRAVRAHQDATQNWSPTYESRKAFQDMWLQTKQDIVDTSGPEVDLDETIRRTGISIFKEGYKMGAVGVESINQFLPLEEQAKMYALDNAYTHGERTGDWSEYDRMMQEIEADLLDNGYLDNSRSAAGQAGPAAGGEWEPYTPPAPSSPDLLENVPPETVQGAPRIERTQITAPGQGTAPQMDYSGAVDRQRATSAAERQKALVRLLGDNPNIKATLGR